MKVICYEISGFKGPDFQNFDYLYLEKEKYFEKHCRRKVAQNNVLNDMGSKKICWRPW